MNETLFTGKAEAYTASRPSYSPEMIRFLYTDCGFSNQSTITDIGAGTGKFSQLLFWIMWETKPYYAWNLYSVKPANAISEKASGQTYPDAFSLNFLSSRPFFPYS